MFTQIIENMNSEQDTFDELKYDITVDGWGTKIYRNKDGEYHRDEGPAIIGSYGSKFWYQNGKRHREDGPAATYKDGHLEWWINDKLHRLDGPAIIYPDGLSAWFLDGIEYTKEEYEQELRKMNNE